MHGLTKIFTIVNQERMANQKPGKLFCVERLTTLAYVEHLNFMLTRSSAL